MCLFKKNTTVQNNESDSNFIVKFPSQVDVLITMAADPDIRKRLEGLKFLAENLSVSPKQKVLELDKTIGHELSDLRIEITKNKGKELLLSRINNVEVLLQERRGMYYEN